MRFFAVLYLARVFTFTGFRGYNTRLAASRHPHQHELQRNPSCARLSRKCRERTDGDRGD